MRINANILAYIMKAIVHFCEKRMFGAQTAYSLERRIRRTLSHFILPKKNLDKWQAKYKKNVVLCIRLSNYQIVLKTGKEYDFFHMTQHPS